LVAAAVIVVNIVQFIYLRQFLTVIVSLLLMRYSVGATALFCKGILGINYDGSINVAMYFMLLMVSADMVIHFVHIHHTSKKIDLLKDKINMRTSYFMRKAIWQTCVPSVVIFACFLGNVFSPLMPIKAIGTFCAVYVLFFYITISLVLPPFLVWQESNWFHRFERVDGIVNKYMFGKKMSNFFADTLNSKVLKFRTPITGFFFLWSLVMLILATINSDTMLFKDIYLPSSNQLVKDFNILTDEF
jgi:hypothetical protein